MSGLRRLWSAWRPRRPRPAPASGELRQAVAAAVRRLRELELVTGSRWSPSARAPWYVLIGEAQSGKSAALRALGFEPVQAASGDERQPSPLGAWCSASAVCWELSLERLEAAPGRPGSDEVARELARGQPRPALAGVLVALSVEQLLLHTEAEREAALRRARECVEQLQQRLECELPVYLLLTQVDRLRGFTPFWARIDAEHCQAPWGASWHERAPAGGSAGVRVAAEWALLGRALHARALQVITRAGAQDAPELFGFSAAFAELGERLSRHVHQLTQSHPARPRLSLRGFYLCTTQPPCQYSQRTGWFLQQLFELAILGDRGSVRRPARVLEREERRRRWQWRALLGAAALVCVPAVLGRGLNLDLIESSARSLQQSEPVAELSEARSGQGAELDPLLLQLRRLESASRRWRVRGWWGPYVAPELEQRLARRYRERLHALVHGPLRAQLHAELRAVGDVVRFDWHNLRQAVDTLELQLMLAQPARLDAGRAAPRLLYSWQRARERGACGGTGPLEPHIERWLRALAADASLALPADEALVAAVRSRLLRLPVPELGLAWLSEAARGAPPVRAAQVFAPSAARSWQVPLGAQVPGLYTRAGWELLRPAFSGGIFPPEDAWIFERPMPASWSSESVRQLHWRRHADAWRAFLLELSAAARAPRAHAAELAWGQRDTLERIQVAAQPDGPLARLFLLLAQNIQFPLAGPAAALSQQVVGELKEKLGAPAAPDASPLEREFAGLLAFAFAEEQRGAISPSSALAEYQRELRALAASLQPSTAPDGTAQVPASVPLQRVAATVQRLLGTLTRAERELLEGLLLAPIEEGLAQLRAGEQRRVAELWRVQVAQPLRRLTERFPFRASASEDVELRELQALLGPQGGALWRFVEAELAQRVHESSSGFELAPPARGEAAMSSALAPCLRAARALRDVLFGGAGLEAMSIRLSSARVQKAALSLTVDGQKLEFLPGGSAAEPSWLPLTWPGSSGPPGAVIELRTGLFADEIRRMGSFGWLRLLSEGGLRASTDTGGLWEARWVLQHGETPVRLELRVPGAAGMPGLALFSALECPAELFGSRPGGPS